MRLLHVRAAFYRRKILETTRDYRKQMMVRFFQICRWFFQNKKWWWFEMGIRWNVSQHPWGPRKVRIASQLSAASPMFWSKDAHQSNQIVCAGWIYVTGAILLELPPVGAIIIAMTPTWSFWIGANTRYKIVPKILVKCFLMPWKRSEVLFRREQIQMWVDTSLDLIEWCTGFLESELNWSGNAMKMMFT